VCREKGDEIERLQGQLEGVRRATEQEFAVKDRMI
jgi:DNA-binding FrmR family transcriptional regulator